MENKETNKPTGVLGQKLGDLKTLRDEIRLKIHLAGMEIKDQWRALEPHLEHIETQVLNAGEAVEKKLVESLDTLKEKLNELRGKLGKSDGAPPKH